MVSPATLMIVRGRLTGCAILPASSSNSCATIWLARRSSWLTHARNVLERIHRWCDTDGSQVPRAVANFELMCRDH